MTTDEEEDKNKAIPETNKKKKKKKGRWMYKKPKELTAAEETVFLNMTLRKKNRALNGTKNRGDYFMFVLIGIFMIAAIMWSGYTRTKQEDYDKSAFVTLSLQEVALMGIWMLVAMFVTTTFSSSVYIELLNWILLYIPFCAFFAWFITDTSQASIELDEAHDNTIIQVQNIILLVFIIVEALAVASFFSFYFLYPAVINSMFFRSKKLGSWFWKIKILSPWTMTYKRSKRRSFFLLTKRNVCKYQGGTNDEGLPQGMGRWFDEDYDGEVLTGYWQNGVPVAPFISRHYGKGDSFTAVRIGYVMNSDDMFDNNNMWPSNKDPSRWSIASVECSVSGAFYNGLPLATLPYGPEQTYDPDTSMESLLGQLIHMGDCRDPAHSEDQDATSEDTNSLTITTDDHQGVRVEGHVHAITGKMFNKVDEVCIKVKKEQETALRRRSRMPSKMEYMPISTRRFSMIAVREDDTSEPQDPFDSKSCDFPTSALTAITENEVYHDANETEQGKSDKADPPKLSLEVVGWNPYKHKDALVFIAGWKSNLKDSLQGFGQFIAMTKLDKHVYPILYAWPSGTTYTYPAASKAANGETNLQNFLQFVKGLQNAGVRNVHFMSHSMGAQTLVGCFCDKADGSRNDVSRCFKLAPDWQGGKMRGSMFTSVSTQDVNDDDSNLLCCKTLTMLNPDFPLDSFVNHSFRSLRRICQTITVVGDRSDTALFFSQLMGGVGVYFGYKQPEAMLPNTRNRERLTIQPSVGRALDELYLPENEEDGDSTRRRPALLFSERAPMALVSEEDGDLDRPWIDMDVIDTTGLDTNVAAIRHSAFNLNPILLNDLEELIRTGDRAMKRSSLLYRDGNLFTYCHAPSYVSYS